MGFVPSWRRRRHRKLAARWTGERRRWVALGGTAAGARAHERPGHWSGAACGRWLYRSQRRRPPPRNSPPDARGGGGGARLKTLLVGGRQIVTCRERAHALRGRELADLEVVQDGAV